MRLLFVKLKHIGDSLLLTPALTAVRANYPKAEVWVVVRKGCEDVLAGCPAIDRLLQAAAPEPGKRSRLNWWQDWLLIRELRRQPFDYVFELSDGDRGRWISYLAGGRVRCANAIHSPLNWWWRGRFNRLSGFDWLQRHRVEKDFYTVNDALPLKGEVPPLAFARERTQGWPPAAGLSDYALIHPGTRWRRKRWPKDKWIELGRFLLKRFHNLVISAGPDPEEVALAKELELAFGKGALSTEGKLSWPQLAGLLYEARLFIGVDTAAMHLAAACRCPTVAIFGPSNVPEWRPWRVRHRVVLPPGGSMRPVGTGTAHEPKTRDVAVIDVIHGCEEVLRSDNEGSRPPHDASANIPGHDA